jgi:hypothetical protein
LQKLNTVQTSRTFNFSLSTVNSKAQVAELVDAADSKSAIRKDVLVRFQSWAQAPTVKLGLFYWPLPITNHSQNVLS